MNTLETVLATVYEAYPLPMGRSEVATKTGANYNTVCGALVRLTKRGDLENVQPGYYKYVPPAERL